MIYRSNVLEKDIWFFNKDKNDFTIKLNWNKIVNLLKLVK